MFLLAAVALCCAVVAGTLALFEPALGGTPETEVADSRPIDSSTQASVRVIGAPFVPNVNPRQR